MARARGRLAGGGHAGRNCYSLVLRKRTPSTSQAFSKDSTVSFSPWIILRGTWRESLGGGFGRGGRRAVLRGLGAPRPAGGGAQGRTPPQPHGWLAG